MDPTIDEIASLFSAEGAVKLLAKPLAENDNSKQQIYLGGSFDVLRELPSHEVTADNSKSRPNFKAQLKFFWMAEDGSFQKAPGAQLILYPDYPEVRLSGFLRGCAVAPNRFMQPIPRELRGPKNQSDGRVLFLGSTLEGKVLAYLAVRGSTAASEFEELRRQDRARRLTGSDVLYELHISSLLKRGVSAELELLDELTRIHALGWSDSIRLNKHGKVMPYSAPNAGGYTLEALLGVIPNGRAQPDFKGWEIKGYSGDRITLMTPEPDTGVYGKEGAERFLMSYGYLRPDGARYFTGTHKANVRHGRTGQTLILFGFDRHSSKIIDVNGGLQLVDQNGVISAGWSYSGLIKHWAAKHSQAAYVKYETRSVGAGRQYRYLSPVQLGVGTDFEKCLRQMSEGNVIYDPATKLAPPKDSGKALIKARNQFRIGSKKLELLYDRFYRRDL